MTRSSRLILVAAAATAMGGIAFAQQGTINDYVRQLVLQARDLSIRQQASEIHLVELPEQKSAMFAFPIDPAKPYRILAACDDDCMDLDLIALDPNGQVLGRDDAEDAGPTLDIRPGTSAGVVRVVVGMADCDADTCVAGLGLFELDE